MHKAALILLAIVTILFASGCGNRMWEDGKDAASDTYDFVFDDAPTAVPYHDTAEIPIIELNYRAADVLYSNVGEGELTLQSAIFVRRFANQNDPSDKAIFGDVVTQQIADRLVQHKVLITQGEPNETDYTYGDGLSAADYLGKTDKKVAELPPRSGQLIGAYVVGDNFIYLSAKVIRLIDSAVVSANNWTIPISDNVREMLPQLKKPDEGLKPTVQTKFE